MGIFFKEPWSVRKQKIKEMTARNNKELEEKIAARNAHYDPLIAEQKKLIEEDKKAIAQDIQNIKNDFKEYGGKIKTDLGFNSQIQPMNSTATAETQSNFDEIKKFKELLDSGIITQEEFDAKKKQLLGL